MIGKKEPALRPITIVTCLFTLISVWIICSGFSPDQPPGVRAILERHQLRDQALKVLGPPVASYINAQGQRVDVFLYRYRLRDDVYTELGARGLTILTLGLYGVYYVVKNVLFARHQPDGAIIRYDNKEQIDIIYHPTHEKVAAYARCIKAHGREGTAMVEEICNAEREKLWVGPYPSLKVYK